MTELRPKGTVHRLDGLWRFLGADDARRTAQTDLLMMSSRAVHVTGFGFLARAGTLAAQHFNMGGVVEPPASIAAPVPCLSWFREGTPCCRTVRYRPSPSPTMVAGDISRHAAP